MYKTKLDIINETAAYYGTDPSRRASNDMGCFYLTDDGKMCAVGRCMIQAKKEYTGTCLGLYENVRGEDGTLISIKTVDLDSTLKEEYRGHEKNFWRDVQELHDYERYYTDTGFNADGLEAIEKLKDKYAKD